MAEVFLAREPLAEGLAKILVIKKIHSSLGQAPQFRLPLERGSPPYLQAGVGP